jgi:hypothetical protein
VFGIADLWLPADRLRRSPLIDVEPGRLIILAPGSALHDSPRIGIKLNVSGAVVAFALTPFYDAGSAVGDAVDLTRERGDALTLEARLTVEANLASDALRGSRREFARGELVDTAEGLGLGAHFGRGGGFQRVCAVSVTSWEMLNDESPRTIFGAWRLRIDIDDHDPIYWRSEIPAAALAA